MRIYDDVAWKLEPKYHAFSEDGFCPQCKDSYNDCFCEAYWIRLLVQERLRAKKALANLEKQIDLTVSHYTSKLVAEANLKVALESKDDIPPERIKVICNYAVATADNKQLLMNDKVVELLATLKLASHELTINGYGHLEHSTSHHKFYTKTRKVIAGFE